MKKKILLAGITCIILSSCTTTTPILKSVAYNGIYEEKPVVLLLMPPINRSTNVESKEYFHSTLNIPIANKGFYVIPPFLSMEILKKESAYDSELFIEAPLTKFREVFGADMALFTIIHKWDKSGIGGKIYIEVEYIIKSTVTNEILFSRRGNIKYDTSVSTGGGGLAGLIADIALTAINTAAKKYIDVARSCNEYTLRDLPAGKYSPKHNLDGEEIAGKKEFSVTLNSNYR